ncbi:MAG: hypothetical protein LBG92_01465 [Prevotellaceae bacterium]|nr:hypothetical protein [Prevotellaceae bacterium]
MGKTPLRFSSARMGKTPLRFCSAHSGRVACTFRCPQATLRSPCGYANSAFQAVYNTLTFSPKGLIFVTAGERSVACGSTKAPNLPEWAKLLAVRRQKSQATLSLACD